MPRGSGKPIHDTLDLCERAAAMLKSCGFEFRNASRKTEACYYGLPGRKELIRIAAHSKWRKAKNSSEFRNVVAKLTFRGTHLTGEHRMALSEESFVHMVERTIGRYHLACATTEGKE